MAHAERFLGRAGWRQNHWLGGLCAVKFSRVEQRKEEAQVKKNPEPPKIQHGSGRRP
jgi:hypothetical protein